MPMEEPPTRFDLRPGLTASVFTRDVIRPGAVVPCWTYTTDGLAAHGQGEIALTLQRRPGDPPGGYPHDVLELYGMIHDLAAQGRLVDVGDYTEFGATGFLGDPDLKGLLYVPFQPIPGREVSEPALSAILVPADELELAKACGVSRVMARLGQAYSHFPCPDWSEQGRPAVVAAAEADQSVLARMPTLALGGAWVVRRGSEIALHLTRRSGSVLGTQVVALRPQHPLALLTGVPPAVDALLVWRPGQRGPVAITAPGASGDTIAGCFCAFVPEQEADDPQVFEDGFAVMLTKRSWRRLRRAAASGADLTLPPGPGGLSFALRWS